MNRYTERSPSTLGVSAQITQASNDKAQHFPKLTLANA